MIEGSGQACQHHLRTSKLFPQSTGFQQVFLHVVAVGTEHHQVTSLNQIAKTVRHPLTAVAVAGHVENGFDMVIVHRSEGVLRKRPQQFASRTGSQQQATCLVLHGAVVSQRCWV